MTMTSTDHPGKRVRAEVLPVGLSVTEAARLLGVGRPALSNFLNGRASLSPEMAARLASTFGIAQERLMDMQAAYDADQARDASRPAGAKPYVPPFLTFKANDIEQWASGNLSARGSTGRVAAHAGPFIRLRVSQGRLSWER